MDCIQRDSSGLITCSSPIPGLFTNEDSGYTFILPADTVTVLIFLLPAGSEVEPSGYSAQTSGYG
jgi:hypothetical protein